MISYLCTSPKPSLEKTDALYNEIDLLKEQFPGNVITLNPLPARLAARFPVLFYGIYNIFNIIKSEKKNSLNHIYAAAIFHMPFVYFLKKPIVYTVFAGINPSSKLPPPYFLKKISKFIVSNQRDLDILKQHGVTNVEVVLSAIDVNKFNKNDLHLNKTLHLMMASAPWDLDQFEAKGIHLILKALQKLEHVHITFLWRNIHVDYMKQLIESYGVSRKITLINEFSDVVELNKKIHGCILLSNNSSIVKAYPSSLVESLVSGKPIIVSREIPIANFSEEHKCGLVLEQFDVDHLINIIESFKKNYDSLKKSALDLNQNIFSFNMFTNHYKEIYQSRQTQ